MSRALRVALTAFAACVLQTNLAQYIRIAGVAPDLLIVFLVLLTGYTGAYGGFCAGSAMALLYDASVGYVLAVNLVAYPFIGWCAPFMRRALDQKLRKVKHKSYLELMLICFGLTLAREVLYVGYLFLIGSEQSVVTLLRMILCAAYSAVLVLPGSLVLRFIMTRHLRRRRQESDLTEDAPAQPHR